jgi:hypothetical protein
MPRRTKNLTKCQILNIFPKELPTSTLPTVGDIILCFSFVHNELQSTSIKVNEIGPTAKKAVAEKVIAIWKKASIPTVSTQRIIAAIGDLILLRRKLVKKPKKNRNYPGFVVQLDKFKKKCSDLFDIAACKCPDLKSCSCALIYKVFFVS